MIRSSDYLNLRHLALQSTTVNTMVSRAYGLDNLAGKMLRAVYASEFLLVVGISEEWDALF